MSKLKPTKRNPWAWIPSLYFAEGIPYIVVMTVSVIMYKRMGISNTDIALYTSWLYLPWVIKALWSPVVDLLKTKRLWIIVMQLFIGAGLAGVAFSIPVPNFFQFTLAFFWLLAFNSATHDIAADGFYMLGLSEHDQAWFVGIRSTFYRFAMIFGQGILIILAGYIESNSGLLPVELTIHSKPSAQITQFISPDEISFPESAGELKILVYQNEIEINTKAVLKSKVDSVINFAKDWNSSNGFYKAGNETSTEAAVEQEEQSWWSRYVAQNLESFIRKYFAPAEIKTAKTDLTGNVGLAYFKLSGEPQTGEDVVMNFGRESGDNSISLVEGTRFVFSKENWEKPAMAVIQLDPKLKSETTTYFVGNAGNIPLAWMITFFILAGLFILFFVYHKFILPYPPSDLPAVKSESPNLFSEFFKTFMLFFNKKKIGLILAFILIYRLGEAQLVKLATPFLLDAQEVGGLALTTGQVGFVYGTIGILFLTLGGIVGGVLAAKHGLKHWIWWMILAINLPDVVYIYLSYSQTTNFLIINLMVAIEQFGYGFGFTAYMLYLIYISEGDHKTSHYAIATGFMALGMMIPGMFSGWLQEIIGYQHFFVWVIISTIPGFIIIKFLDIDPEFGKKSKQEKV